MVTTNGTPNYKGLVEYLGSLGINANRIPEDSVKETGYSYWPDPDHDPVRYGSDHENPVNTEFNVPWPNKDVYPNVLKLIAGGTMTEVIDAKPTPIIVNNPDTDKKPTPAQVKKIAALKDTE